MVGGAISQVGLGGLIRRGPRVLVVVDQSVAVLKRYDGLALFQARQRVTRLVQLLYKVIGRCYSGFEHTLLA